MLDTWGYKHTLSICNTYCFSTTTMVARTQFTVTKHVHCLSCSTRPRSDVIAVSTNPFRLLNILPRVLLIKSVHMRLVVALLFTIPAAFRGTWSFEGARRKPLSCTSRHASVAYLSVLWTFSVLNPFQPRDAKWYHAFHLFLICMPFAHWLQ